MQLKDPILLLQTAHGSQLCTFVVHSLISIRKREIRIYDYIAVKPNLKKTNKQTNKGKKLFLVAYMQKNGTWMMFRYYCWGVRLTVMIM